MMMIRAVGLIGFTHLLKTRKLPKKRYATTQISQKAQSLDTNGIPVRIFAWGFPYLWAMVYLLITVIMRIC